MTATHTCSRAAAEHELAEITRFLEKRLKRLHEKARPCWRKGRGRSLAATTSELNRLLRGWMSYFQLTEVKGVLEEPDRWVCHRLRYLFWRQPLEPCLSTVLLRTPGAGFAGGYAPARPVRFMNRRMRSRMFNGVAGRRA